MTEARIDANVHNYCSTHILGSNGYSPHQATSQQYGTLRIRGFLHGDVFSRIAFIAGLDRIFQLHDAHTIGFTVKTAERKFDYADDADLVDEHASTATAIESQRS